MPSSPTTTERMSNDLPHQVRQGLLIQLVDGHPTPTLQRLRLARHLREEDGELQWKMREDVVDHTGAASPAHRRAEIRRGRAPFRWVEIGTPLTARHFAHAAKQPGLRTTLQQDAPVGP